MAPNTSYVTDRLTGELAYLRAKRNPRLEALDGCGRDWVGVPPNAEELTPEHFRAAPLNLRAFREGAALPHGGKVLKTVRGMGKVLDWRTSPWTPANGGKIKPLVFVQHIPVIPNTVGIGDFVQLRNVLVVQGLMIQCATDSEGNVALYTPFNSLCFQARGANQVSTGCEHMHSSISEPWTKKQMRAAAWVTQLAEAKHHIPLASGKLGAGSGFVKVLRRGQVTHEGVSNKAGFRDRTDPGDGFEWDYMRHCAKFYAVRGHMVGA